MTFLEWFLKLIRGQGFYNHKNLNIIKYILFFWSATGPTFQSGPNPMIKKIYFQYFCNDKLCCLQYMQFFFLSMNSQANYRKIIFCHFTGFSFIGFTPGFVRWQWKGFFYWKIKTQFAQKVFSTLFQILAHFFKF